MPRRTFSLSSPADPAPSPPPTDVERYASQVRSLLAETQAISARLAALNEVAAAVQASLELDTVLETLAREARWVLDFQHCAVWEVDGDERYERVLRGAGAGARRARDLDGGPVSQAIAEGHARLLRRLAPEDGAPAGMQSALILPLHGRGQVIGALTFFAARPDHYSLDDLRVAAALATQVAAALQNSRLFQAVTAARDELDTIVESIGDGVAVVDADGRVVLVNGAARRLLSLPAGPLAGRRALGLARLGRARGQRLISVQQLRAAAAALAGPAQGALALSDGRHLAWSATPLPTRGGSPGYVLTLRDISAQIALEQLRDDMIAMLVHDLRTPLTSVMLSLDLLGMTHASAPPEERAELIDRASTNARHLMRQVDTLLDMRKLEAGQLDLDRDYCRLDMLASRATSRLRDLAAFADVELRNAVPLDLESVLADPGLLVRVLENLLGNATKFSPPGAAVMVGAQRLPAAIEVTVSDRGPGVPAEMRELIFEKFTQARAEHRRRGTGLGLAFCKLVIEAHGGAIGVRDNPGGGSIFWFTLPPDEQAAYPLADLSSPPSAR